ncbi:hypothetical protein BDV18DRAFT_145204 [Aspergillus unguis]
MSSQTEPQSLHVLIAGAGIGGLSAAIALRKQGHRVEVCSLRSFNGVQILTV